MCVCARAHVCIGCLSIHIYTRHMYLKSLSPSVHCRRTKSVLPVKMHIRCYINKNDMIFNVISLFHIINHFLKDFCIGHIISKSSSILILKAPHFFKISSLKREIRGEVIGVWDRERMIVLRILK